jgi:hypothetical protein
MILLVQPEPLRDSLKRYFANVIPDMAKSENISIVIDEDYSLQDDEILEILSIPRKRIIIIGTTYATQSGYYSLCNLADMKNYFSLMNDINAHALSFNNQIHSRLEHAFVSHGDESLIKQLNESQYYIFNGIRLFRNGMCSWDEYRNLYLGQALIRWHNFGQKHSFFKKIFLATGFQEEINKVGNKFNEISNWLEKASLASMEQTLNMNPNEITIRNWLREMEDILIQVSRTLGLKIA